MKLIKPYNFTKKLSFEKRIFISFLVASLLPLCLIGVLTFFQAEKNAYAEKKDIIENNLNQVANTLETKINSINRASELLIFNTALVEIFDHDINNISDYQKYLIFRDKINPVFNYVSVVSQDLEKITVYTTSSIGGIRSDIKSLNDKTIDTRISHYKLENSPTWIVEGNKIYVLNEIPSVLSPNHRTIIELKVDTSSFVKPTPFINEEFMLSINKEDSVLFPKNFDHSAKVKDHLTKSFTGNDWTLHYYVLPQKISLSGQYILIGTFSLFFFSILLAIVLTRFFSKDILRVLGNLKNNVKKVMTEKSTEVDFSSDHEDEFGELSNLIGEMVRSIEDLMNDVYVATIEKQDSQYQALVNQINSHFLYNTLSLINWKAIMIENEEISYIAQSLSTYYRTTLNHGKTALILADELRNVQSYIDLQLFLKPNLFAITFDLEETLSDSIIINLLLQPIVENSIEHGFKEIPPHAEILIRTRLDNTGNLIIQIKDNGIGMSEKRLDDVLSYNQAGYGLKNINKRIQFYFGSSYGLTIHSVQNVGTTAIIKLPNIKSVSAINQLKEEN